MSSPSQDSLLITMPDNILKLLPVAQAGFDQAYAPYSKFKVGAALQSLDGQIWQGSNVEIASLGGTICAERSALVAAVSHGQRQFSEVLVLTDAPHPTAPCGHCRQAMVEFAPQLKVTSMTISGLQKSWFLSELLPDYFGPADLLETT